VQQKIVAIIRDGNYANVAAACVGICEDTFYEWIARGEREPGSKYSEFSEAVKRAAAEAEAESVSIIETAGRDQWQARAWLLERKSPHKWGRQDRTEHGGEVRISIRREGDAIPSNELLNENNK